MFNKFSGFVFAILAALSSTGANANFDVVNQSSENIYVSVLTTEIFRDGFVHQFKTVRLGPGDHYDFLTNDVVNGRTVSLSIRSEQARGNYFDRFNMGHYGNWRTHFGRVQWTPYWPQERKRMGNKFVARQAVKGDYTPLVNTYGGSTRIKAMQVVPINGGKKGVRVWYNGFHGNLGFAAW